MNDAPEDYADWLLDAAPVAAADGASALTGNETRLLVNPSSVKFLSSPIGLICCLNDVAVVPSSVSYFFPRKKVGVATSNKPVYVI